MDAGTLDIALAIAVVGAAGYLFLRIRGGRVDLFAPSMLVGGIIVLAYMIRPVLTHIDPLGWTTFRSDFVAERDDCLIQSIVFATMFLAAFGFAISRPAPHLLHRFTPSLAPVSTSRVFVVGGILLLSSAIASWRLLFQAGLSSVIGAAAFDAETRVALMQQLVGDGFAYTLSSAGPLFFCVVLASILAARSERNYSGAIKVATIALLAAGFATVLLFALLFGSRQMLIGGVLSAVLIIHYMWLRIPLAFQIGAIASAAVSAGLLGLLLTDERNLEVLGGFSIFSAIRRLGGTFEQYEMLCICMQRAPTDFLFGRSIAEDVFWTYLPRALFPFKPEVYGAVLLQDMLLPDMFTIAGLTATYPVGILAESYLNFGPAGPLLFGGAAGLIVRLAIERANRGEWLYVVLLTTIVCGNVVGFVRGFGGVIAALLFFGALFKLLFCTPMWSVATLRRAALTAAFRQP